MQSRMLIAILAVVDLLLLVGNVVHWRTEHADPIFSTTAWDGDLDQSYIENFGHILLIASIVMLLFVVLRRPALVLYAWILILTVVLVDDFFMVHERGGDALAAGLGLPAVAGLRPVDLGELFVWGALAVPLACLLIIGHLRASEAGRRDSRTLFVLVGLLAAFAVVLDAVSHPLGAVLPPLLGTLFTLTETAGELVAVSLIAVAVHRMTLRPTR
jgi:hypothetical protein